MDWIDLAQDRDKCLAVVNTVRTFGFHKMRGISWVAWDVLASQEGLCSMELLSYYFYYSLQVTEFNFFASVEDTKVTFKGLKTGD
jgi:hypothetical protein